MILLLEIKNKKRRKIRPSFNAVSAANSRQIARNCDKPPPSSLSRSRALDGKRWKREGGGERGMWYFIGEIGKCASKPDPARIRQGSRSEFETSRLFRAIFISFFPFSVSLSLSADFHGSLTHRKIYSNDTRYGVIVRGRLDVFGESVESRLSIFDWNWNS